MGQVRSQHLKSLMKFCSNLGRYEVDCMDDDWPWVTNGDVPASTLRLQTIHVSGARREKGRQKGLESIGWRWGLVGWKGLAQMRHCHVCVCTR